MDEAVGGKEIEQLIAGGDGVTYGGGGGGRGRRRSREWVGRMWGATPAVVPGGRGLVFRAPEQITRLNPPGEKSGVW